MREGGEGRGGATEVYPGHKIILLQKKRKKRLFVELKTVGQFWKQRNGPFQLCEGGEKVCRVFF
jgi:hypothetical protein